MSLHFVCNAWCSAGPREKSDRSDSAWCTWASERRRAACRRAWTAPKLSWHLFAHRMPSNSRCARERERGGGEGERDRESFMSVQLSEAEWEGSCERASLRTMNAQQQQVRAHIACAHIACAHPHSHSPSLYLPLTHICREKGGQTLPAPSKTPGQREGPLGEGQMHSGRERDGVRKRRDNTRENTSDVHSVQKAL